MTEIEQNMRAFLGLLLLALAFTGGCKGKMAKIEALHAALVSGDAGQLKEATASYPACPDLPADAKLVTPPNKPGPYDAGCLSEIANALGSTIGFAPTPPDHAAATTAALILVRDGRGDWIAHVDTWLGDVKNGKGIGHDTLRLAIARKMTEAAPLVGRKIEDDASAAATMKAIASAIPGACPTYYLLGAGTNPAVIPAELSADHAACVQKDLARREGPGARYGAGTMRALEGSLAVWREMERALRLGLPNAEPNTKVIVEKALTVIEGASAKIATKKVESATPADVLDFMGEVHAEAGIPIVKPKADAGLDAAAAAATTPSSSSPRVPRAP